MRTFSLLILSILSATSLGCKSYCCRTADGTPFVATFGCGDLEELRQQEEDEDLDDFKKSCEGDPEETDTTNTSAGTPCEQFCRQVLDACPSDSACLHSCEDLAARTPSSDDIDCADRAVNCSQTDACFASLF